MRHRLATPRASKPMPCASRRRNRCSASSIGDGLPAILATRPRQGQGRMEPSHPGPEREANVRLATRLKTAVVLVRRIVRRPCRSELRLFLAPPESFCLSNPFAAIAPVEIRARREAASPSYPRAGPGSGPQSDRQLVPSLRCGVFRRSVNTQQFVDPSTQIASAPLHVRPCGDTGATRQEPLYDLQFHPRFRHKRLHRRSRGREADQT